MAPRSQSPTQPERFRRILRQTRDPLRRFPEIFPAKPGNLRPAGPGSTGGFPGSHASECPADAGGGPIPKARLADPRASRKGRRGRGRHEGGGELVRRRRSRESDAGSGKRRLLFRPSPFAAARLSFAPLSPLPSFCARSVCPPHPFSLLLCFQGLASFSPGLLFVRPGFRAAIPGENPVRPGFSAWRNPALAVSDPGTSRCSIELPDWPRGIRTALGEIHRRDPGARRRRGGLRAEQCH
jgi:hypothetical protein